MTDCKSLDVNVCKSTEPGDEACDACQYRRATHRAERAEHRLAMTAQRIDALLENEFGGFYLSAPADDPLGQVREILRTGRLS